MGLFNELKHRNVFRVGAAYILLGWLIIQVADVVVPHLPLPDWTTGLVILLVFIGFPFALLFAWAYELTSEGIQRESGSVGSGPGASAKRFDPIVFGLLVVAASVWLIVDSQDVEEQHHYASIAVLPFDNLSGDPQQAYLSAGLTDELLNTFASIETLKVAAPISSRAALNEKLSIAEVGDALGVESVLMGSLRMSDDQLLITARLIDTASNFQIWTGEYNILMTEVFDVQDEIARRILTALQGRLVAGQAGAVVSTRNPQAYEEYLKGVRLAQNWERELLAESQKHLTAATEMDPRFAEAWAGRALAYFRIATQSQGREQQEGLEQARQMNERAMELDPELAEAHAITAQLLAHDYRYDEALEANKRAIDRRPSYAEAHQWRSRMLRSLGHIDAAEIALAKAYELDKLNPRILFTWQTRECHAYRPALSIERLDKLAEQIHPVGLMLCATANQHFARGIETIEANTPMRPIWPYVYVKQCDQAREFAASGVDGMLVRAACVEDEAALAFHAELPDVEKYSRVVLEWLAIVQMRQGLFERALATLQRAHDGRVPVIGNTSVGGISSNASLALHRVQAARKLGIEAEEDILPRVQQLIDNLKASGAQRGYRLLEAKLMLLQGDLETAEALIQAAVEAQSMSWISRYDPIFLDYLGEDRVRELTMPIEALINAERTQLGWQPAEF